ncbi:PREDICTED: diacylglycerol kinase epsilon [Papilio polytes]|uniref:diacylglycerol kinase epsilon n=1 Tax=Papilio polytes TaxID=76194 RepID=UPI000675D87A|nr:PREDICTED: diacylglycerol kinase epsilon [Papilio polytes]
MDFYLRYIDITTNYYFLIGGFFLSYLIYKIVFSFVSGNNFMQTIYSRGRYGHTWRSIECNKSLPYNIYCSVCSELMLPVVGLFCECCALSACKKCNRILDKKFRCKQISWPSDKPFYHHWVDIGTTTGKDEGQNESLKKLFCSWCQRTKIIKDNLLNDTEQCDFSKYRKLIIPPACVQLHRGTISNIKPPPDDDWEPLIVLANRKSGSSRSDEVISIFRGLLNPIQVVDISSISPEKVIKWLPNRCRLLIAGGDGTVAWVLNALKPATHISASVGILPMGTGNDLSRVLGWGAGLPLPPLQALVALNIPSWGAGVHLWNMGNEGEMPEQSVSDGKLEVVGISSSFHIARLQVGLAEPYRFTQTSRLKIELSGSCAMQVDGEPWMQSAATITIEPDGQCCMLRAPHHYADTA